jgi:DNA-binding transcriptional ArsR family regulator
MSRQGVLGHFQETGEIARGQSLGFVFDERPECFQTGRLRKGCEGQNGYFSFHISRFMEVLPGVNRILRSVRPMHPDISNILEISIDAVGMWMHDVIMKIDDAAARLEALGNPTRLKIYRALVRAGHAGMPVGRLQERLKIPASTLSHHVKGLVSVGLVSQKREGTTLVCHAEYDAMQTLVNFLVAECCIEESGCGAAQSAA